MQSIHTSETNMTGVKVKFNAEPSKITEAKEIIVRSPSYTDTEIPAPQLSSCLRP